ncbi:hypothetical protein [Streptomyces sp. NPDC056660]|uniref:hypothetical protein n=1 Tax=Streptomyces sp. NPDC056660 TaxID=3345897 RepID=UPI0036C726A9
MGLFDESTLRRIADMYLRVLDALTEDHARPVDDLDLIDAGERHRLTGTLHPYGGPASGTAPWPGRSRNRSPEPPPVPR